MSRRDESQRAAVFLLLPGDLAAVGHLERERAIDPFRGRCVGVNGAQTPAVAHHRPSLGGLAARNHSARLIEESPLGTLSLLADRCLLA